MNRDKNIQEEIEKTLTSLDGISARKVKPYFYTRLQSKLDATIQKESFSLFFDTPFLKPILATLFVAINIITVWQIYSNENSLLTERQEIISSFTEEYSFNQSTDTYFDIENE